MLVNTSWLLDYLEPKCSAKELLDTFTKIGLEVEESFHLAEELRDVIVGFIRSKQPLAGADGLYHCKIEVARNEIRDIVCASEHEVQVGWGVPVVPVGLKLPTGKEVKRAHYHGVLSEGMIALDGEMGMVSRGTGLQVFQDEKLLGKSFPEVTDIPEYFVNVTVLPNRPDCLGLIGIAREVAGFLNLKLKYPVPIVTDCNHKATQGPVPVNVVDAKLCPRYLCQLIRGVKVQPSPAWLKSRLLIAGLRPINNIVDVTNFILYEWGQPLHAFDFGQIRGGKLEVRLMRPEESLTLLDGQTITGEKKPLVIADGERPVALAGIMGGTATQTALQTTDVLVEAACFDPVNIRETSRRSGIRSDSSYRFERGTDPNGMLSGALSRACSLMLELAGGRADGGVSEVYPERKPPRTFRVTPERVSNYLGKPVDGKTIRTALESLEMKYGADCQVEVPTWRVDVNDPVVLIEDVAHHIGYDQIPLKPMIGTATAGFRTPMDHLRDSFAKFLAANGFLECRNPPLVDPEWVGSFNREPAEAIRITNPLRSDMAALRTSLLPSLLDAVARNVRRGAETFRLFEIDRAFRKTGSEPVETWRLGLVMGGLEHEAAWSQRSGKIEFSHLKGVVENLLEQAGIADARFEQLSCAGFIPGRAASIIVDGKSIGTLGEVDPAHMAKSKLRVALFACELDLPVLLPTFTAVRAHHELPRTQAVTRDLTVIVAANLPFAEIAEAASTAFTQAAQAVHTAFLKSAENEADRAAAKSPVLEQVFCTDMYRGKPIPPDRKSITVRLVFRDAGRTLTAEESNAILESVIRDLGTKFQAELRT